jgi:hypothetical protein
MVVVIAGRREYSATPMRGHDFADERRRGRESAAQREERFTVGY